LCGCRFFGRPGALGVEVDDFPDRVLRSLTAGAELEINRVQHAATGFEIPGEFMAFFVDPRPVISAEGGQRQAAGAVDVAVGEVLEGVAHGDGVADAVTPDADTGVGGEFGIGLDELLIFTGDLETFDRSFVSKIADNEKSYKIVEATLMMAKSLSLKVVAEGVETEEQLKLIKDMGCRCVQGYVYSKPLSIDAFLEFARNHH